MAKEKSFFRKLTDSLVSRIGYVPFTKEEATGFKSVSLNFRRGMYGVSGGEDVKKNGLRKPSNVSFKTLRQLAKHDAVIRICVNVIKKAVSQAEWDIVVKDEAPNKKEYYKKHKEQVYELFEFMNANGENMRILLDRVLEDLLVLDAAAIEKVWSIGENANGEKTLLALNSVDGATIRPIYNQYGELGDPAYKQFIGSNAVAEFSRGELVYIMANPQNDVDSFGYGLSPIESVLLQVQASLEADLYNIKNFTKDNIPPGMLDLGDMTDDEAEQFIATWNATVIGNSQAMKFIWGSGGDKKFIPFNGSNRDMQYVEYIDWLTRIKLAAYGLTGIDANITQDLNRATASVQAGITSSRGVRSTKSLIEEYFTRQIIREMGEEFKWLEFKFKPVDNIEDKLTQAKIDEINLKNKVVTPDFVREREGIRIEQTTGVFSDILDEGIRNAQQVEEGENIDKTTTFGKHLYS